MRFQTHCSHPRSHSLATRLLACCFMLLTAVARAATQWERRAMPAPLASHTTRITPPHSAEAHEPRAWLDSQLTQNSHCLAPRTQLTVVCHTHQKHAASTYSPLCALPSHSVAAPQSTNFLLDVQGAVDNVKQRLAGDQMKELGLEEKVSTRTRSRWLSVCPCPVRVRARPAWVL